MSTEQISSAKARPYPCFLPNEKMPFRQGNRIRIPAGTVVDSTHPRRKRFTLTRAHTIVVNHTLPGIGYPDSLDRKSPRVCWPGTGGYWCEVDINDLVDADGKPHYMNPKTA
jgi:hypothetical protein